MSAYPSVVLSKKSGAVFQANPQKPYPPAPGPDEVLIRNVAVASNPKDWKLSKVGVFEGIEGNDVAGYVEAVGKNVTEFKRGDRVGAFTKMATSNAYGAYQTHSLSPSWTVFPLGSHTSFEDAATLPLAVMTAAIGLFVKLGLHEPLPDGSPNPKAKGQGVLVWGASSSVGAFAVQLAKKAGYYVIGIAGAGAPLAYSLGCSAVVDYRSGPVVPKIQAAISASGVKFTTAYDAHSAASGSSSSYADLAEALQPGGGKVTVVLGVPKSASAKVPKNVQIVNTQVGSAHVLSAKGDGEFARRWFRQIAQWLDEGKFKANVVKVIPGGLAGVKEGLKLMEEGKVSGEKLVCKYILTVVEQSLFISLTPNAHFRASVIDRIDETPKGKL
ncbi:hypothetical protein HDU93_008573 [Gonapodya sp. JEL0774]|nr:hypothetical protein HDU93_008573 [Gonapodya sp. JEL0774]